MGRHCVELTHQRPKRLAPAKSSVLLITTYSHHRPALVIKLEQFFFILCTCFILLVGWGLNWCPSILRSQPVLELVKNPAGLEVRPGARVRSAHVTSSGDAGSLTDPSVSHAWLAGTGAQNPFSTGTHFCLHNDDKECFLLC